MAETVITTPYTTYLNGIEASRSSVKPTNMYGLRTDYAVSNKWIGYVPLENALGRSYNNLELHLTRFSLPQQEMSSMTASYKGYQKEVPSKVMNSGSKQLTLEYIVDADWKNYKALYLWMSSILGNINPVVADEKVQPITPNIYIPIRIYLIDQYKKKIVQFLFENCWIKTFNDIALDCANSEEVHHSFVMCYDQYTIENI